MNAKNVVLAMAAVCTAGLFAQLDARAAYQQRQAVQEVQRLSSQFDQLQHGMDSLSSRMNRIESNTSQSDVRAEVAALRSELNALKRRQEAMREEIVADISKKMAALIAKSRPAPEPPPRGGSTPSSSPSKAPAATGPMGPYFEHTVEPGETLSYIAKECKTTVKKIMQYNNMKNHSLRVGQVVKIPAEGEN